MVEPIRPTTKPTFFPVDSVPEQRLDSRNQVLRPVVNRKAETPAAKEDIPREQVEKAAEKLNRLMGIIDRRLEFSVHEKSGQLMVKVIDQTTGDVLDEIPSKRALDILSSFDDLVGLLVDKRV